MYAIGMVIYGVPLTEDVNAIISEFEESEIDDGSWFEDNEGTCGFTTLYSGCADGLVGYCGVRLTEDFGTYDYFKLSDITVQPTEEQKQEALEKMAKLHPKIKEVLLDVDIWVIWYTS